MSVQIFRENILLIQNFEHFQFDNLVVIAEWQTLQTQTDNCTVWTGCILFAQAFSVYLNLSCWPDMPIICK